MQLMNLSNLSHTFVNMFGEVLILHNGFRFALHGYCLAGLCLADEEGGDEAKEYFVDEGGNLTLPCIDNDGEDRVKQLTDKTYWIHEGKTVDSTVLDDDSLFLEHLRREDAGVYKCANVQSDDVLNKMRVYVRSKYRIELTSYLYNLN